MYKTLAAVILNEFCGNYTALTVAILNVKFLNVLNFLLFSFNQVSSEKYLLVFISIQSLQYSMMSLVALGNDF